MQSRQERQAYERVEHCDIPLQLLQTNKSTPAADHKYPAYERIQHCDISLLELLQPNGSDSKQNSSKEIKSNHCDTPLKLANKHRYSIWAYPMPLHYLSAVWTLDLHTICTPSCEHNYAFIVQWGKLEWVNPTKHCMYTVSECTCLEHQGLSQEYYICGHVRVSLYHICGATEVHCCRASYEICTDLKFTGIWVKAGSQLSRLEKETCNQARPTPLMDVIHNKLLKLCVQHIIMTIVF